MKNPRLTCLRCGYEWVPRKVVPIACPRCKRYDWNVDKLKTDATLKKAV